LLGIIISKLIEQHFIEIDLDLINNHIARINNELKNIDKDADIKIELEKVIRDHEITVAIFDDNNNIIYGTEDMRQRNIPDLLAHNSRLLHWENGANMYRGLRGTIAAPLNDLKNMNIILGLKIQHHDAFMVFFQRTLLIAIAISIGCLIIFGWIITRFSLAPLHRIIAKTSEVSSEKLDTRLDVGHLPYELKELATSLNTMLARLEDSFRRLFDFSSDLAHELRTPISTMKIQTQVALMHSRTLEEYNTVLQSNIEELDRLARMINDMLFLAKSGNALVLPHKELMALDQELCALFEFYEAFAEDRGITFILDGQASLRGDKLMLRRALGNLITNAVTHSFRNTAVQVRLEHAARGCIGLTVSSRGETIAPEHLPRLFDRFYRMDSARQRSSDGVGLGLAITRSIIQAHGGNIVATSASGLTEFHVTLPEA
ncbi:MAG: heavy metal sensor histidine kinase, partial [Deltaproteobacteria bacterium]|nr:heavy metal sensor histidine kinase [Deltaproteobacteria bacterium]